MVQTEKRLLWHPGKTNKFVVSDTSRIVLYEWAAQSPQIRHITSQHDLHSMKCFAWSPDPTFDDLLAIGLNTGRVDLIRLEANKQSRKNVLSSGPITPLGPIRSQRPCTALAFCSVDPNYLAVGLEKARGDSGLVIWDINTLLPSLKIASDISNMNTVQSRPLPHIPRVDTHARLDQRMVQQHALNEAVYSLSFLPSSTHLLLANISNRFLRLFDLRTPSIPAITVTTKLRGIATDPFDSHRIASFGDSTVTVWDVRKFLQPFVTFSERDALADGAFVKPGSTYSTIEFSSTKRGTIATLERDSTYVRFWDLSESRVGGMEGSVIGAGGSSDGETKSSRDSSRAARKSWTATIPWPTSGDKDRFQREKELSSSLELVPAQQTFVLSDTRRTKSFSRPLASFALVPDSSPNPSLQLTSKVMVVNKDGDLELYAIHDTPKQIAWSSRGTLALGAGLGLKVLDGYKDDDDDKNEEGEGGFISEEGPQQRRRSTITESPSRDAVSMDRERKRRTSPSPSSSAPRRSISASRRGRKSSVLTDHAGQQLQAIPTLPVIPSSVSTTPTVSTIIIPTTTATSSSPALFGRGDEDGFPALPTPALSGNTTTGGGGGGGAAPTVGRAVATSSLSATDPRKSRQSPSRILVASGRRSLDDRPETRDDSQRQKKRSLSRTDTVPADTFEEDNNTHDYDHDEAERNTSWSREASKPDSIRSRAVKSQSRGRERMRKSRDGGVVGLVKEDISMVMRQRAKAGYGLSQLSHNIVVTQDRNLGEGVTQGLSGTLAWLYHSQEILCVPTPHLHGYDFSYQGLLGIWESFPPMPNAHRPAPTPQQQQQHQPFVDNEQASIQRSSLLLEIPPIIGPQQLLPAHLHGHSHSGSPTPIITNNNNLNPTGPSTINHTKARSQSPTIPIPSTTTTASVGDPHASWLAALSTLASRRGVGGTTTTSGGDLRRRSMIWKPTVPTSKLVQRQIGLQIIGWSLREDELSAAIKRWQKEGQFARAACWLVFMRQYGRAVDLLMRSSDETHQMMSGTIAALAPLMTATGSAQGLELRELYGRLIIKLNDPYFRMLLTHLSTNEWSEVLDEELIPFRERLAIAFQFLDDKAITAYLRRVTEQACEHGTIEGLMVTGLTTTGMRILQSYLDHTGDVQSAAILSSYVCPHRIKYDRAGRWLEAYRDLLDGFKLHHLRVGFDIERGQILHEAMVGVQSGEFGGGGGGGVAVEEWAPRQIVIRCHYCNSDPMEKDGGGGGGDVLPGGRQKTQPRLCSNCERELPRCSVCLMTLSIVGDAAREAALSYTLNRDTFDDAIVICQTCRHGGHAGHILEWFLGEDGRRTRHTCPVADCNCRCADEF